MKKLFILLMFVAILPLNAHPFWIWSGKDKKLKNPNITAKLSPAFRLQDGIKQMDNKRYKKAKVIFQSIVKQYPDAIEAAEAQYYYGLCLEKMGHAYPAYQAYQKVINTYPNSKRINEIIEREMAIAESFMNKDAKAILFFKKYDFVEHPSIEIFKSISAKTAVVAYAAKAQYQLGILFFNLKRYEDAKEAFGVVIDKYPESEWYAPAKYQLAHATAQGFSGTDYDGTAVTEAAQRLDEFVSSHPDSDVTPQAAEQLKDLNNKEAQKGFETAAFYETIGKNAASRIYYEEVADKYPDTVYGVKAREALHRLDKHK